MHNVESVFFELGLDMMHLQPMVLTLIFLAANLFDNGVTVVLAVKTTVTRVNSVVKVTSFIIIKKRVKKRKKTNFFILIYIYT